MVNKLIKLEQERFYAAMGRFVLAWADMEFCLDLVVLNGRKLKSPLPHQLSDKTNFVRKVLVPHSVQYMRQVYFLSLMKLMKLPRPATIMCMGQSLGMTFTIQTDSEPRLVNGFTHDVGHMSQAEQMSQQFSVLGSYGR